MAHDPHHLRPLSPEQALPVLRPRPALARAAGAYAFVGGIAAGVLATPLLIGFTHAHVITAVRASAIGGCIALGGAALSAWAALLERAGLREAAHSAWWPVLFLSVWGLAVAFGTLAYHAYGFGAGFVGSMAGVFTAVSGFTAAWAVAWRDSSRDVIPPSPSPES